MINDEPNYLNLLEARQVDILPPHFKTISMPATYNTNTKLQTWIYENCKGRFYIGKGVELKEGSIENVIKIGFEEPKESSYFILACPYLKYH
jgi:hypothetical protein